MRKNIMNIKLFIVFLTTAILFSASCGGDDGRTDEDAEVISYWTLLDEAKQYMSVAKYTEARMLYERVLDNTHITSEISEAKFGFSFSRTLEIINDLLGIANDLLTDFLLTREMTPSEVVTLVSKTSNVGAVGPLPKTGIGLMVESMLAPYVDDFSLIDQYMEDIKTDPNFEWTIDSLPLTLSLGPFSFEVANLGGRYDIGEVYIGQTLDRLLLGTFAFLLSVDLDIDLGAILGDLFGEYVADSTMFDDMTTQDIVGLIVYVLEVSPGLFGLDPYSGVSRMQTAGVYYGDAFDNLLSGIEFWRNENIDEKDTSLDIISIQNIEGQETIVVSISIDENPFADEEVSSNLLGSEIYLPLTAAVEQAFVNIRDNFRLTGGRVSWANDMVPILSTVLVMILKTGIVEMLLDALGASLPESIGSLLTDSTFITVEFIGGIITGIIPDIFQFDFGRFFSEPQALRDMLPAWTTSSRLLMGNTFILEWECWTGGLSEDADLICPSESEWDWSYIDNAHFPGYRVRPVGEYLELSEQFSDEFTAADLDGIQRAGFDNCLNLLPYVAFPKPHFAQLLYTNTSMYAGGPYQPAAAFELATNESLNAILCNVVGAILGLIG
jgi:hypothetical protein